MSNLWTVLAPGTEIRSPFGIGNVWLDAALSGPAYLRRIPFDLETLSAPAIHALIHAQALPRGERCFLAIVGGEDTVLLDLPIHYPVVGFLLRRCRPGLAVEGGIPDPITLDALGLGSGI